MICYYEPVTNKPVKNSATNNPINPWGAEHSKIENLNALFGYNIYGKNDKPTNGEFIALVADKLLMEEQGKKAG